MAVSILYLLISLIVGVTHAAVVLTNGSATNVYQLATMSPKPNALIEITNWLNVPMVLLKKDLQFHGSTPFRQAPWTIEPMTHDAFLVSPIKEPRTGAYMSIYGAIVYEIRESDKTTAFALYFSVPDGHAKYRFPWFGLEIHPFMFEQRMIEAIDAEFKGSVTNLNTYTRRFGYATAGRPMRVGTSDYRISARMKMTSDLTAFIAVSVQPTKERPPGAQRPLPLVPSGAVEPDPVQQDGTHAPGPTLAHAVPTEAAVITTSSETIRGTYDGSSSVRPSESSLAAVETHFTTLHVLDITSASESEMESTTNHHPTTIEEENPSDSNTTATESSDEVAASHSPEVTTSSRSTQVTETQTDVPEALGSQDVQSSTAEAITTEITELPQSSSIMEITSRSPGTASAVTTVAVMDSGSPSTEYQTTSTQESTSSSTTTSAEGIASYDAYTEFVQAW